ncbi:MAG: hypothetical protein AB7E76_07540 [Deferribacterales bacterium]
MITTMRFLHRYIGFLVVGITFIYAVSGVLLTYRDSDFLKSEREINIVIDKGVPAGDLGKEMHAKIDIVSAEGSVITFSKGEYTGTYDSATGELAYTSKELPYIIQKMVNLHKSTSAMPSHMFNVTYGLLLLFLALSSFFMYKPTSRQLRKGIAVSAIGAVLAIGLLI